MALEGYVPGLYEKDAELITTAGYGGWQAVEGPGRVAVAEIDDGGWAFIYTDDKRAGGVATAPGNHYGLLNALAHYFQEAAEDGRKPGDVFDELAYGLAEEVYTYDDLPAALYELTGQERPGDNETAE